MFLEKATSLDCGEIIKACLKCTGFMKTPVMDLLSTDNRDVHDTENPDTCMLPSRWDSLFITVFFSSFFTCDDVIQYSLYSL